MAVCPSCGAEPAEFLPCWQCKGKPYLIGREVPADAPDVILIHVDRVGARVRFHAHPKAERATP